MAGPDERRPSLPTMSQQDEFPRQQQQQPPPPSRSANRVRRSDSGSDPLRRRNADSLRSRPQMTDFEFLDVSQVQVDSSSSDSDFRPKRPPRPHHGRSMSHPFPSLFSGRKKKREDPGSSDGDGDTSAMPSLRGSRGLLGRRPPLKDTPAAASRDFTTGNCMTCGSLMRWPRELDVFKCTICLTINDLKPMSRAQKQPGGDFRHGRRREDDSAASAAQTFSHAQPISVEHTKLLVRQCLRNFILLSLSGDSSKALLQLPSIRSAQTVDDGAAEARQAQLEEPDMLARATHVPVWDPEAPDMALSGTSIGIAMPPRLNSHGPRSHSTSYPDHRPRLHTIVDPPGMRSGINSQNAASGHSASVDVEAKKIFKPLEDYVVTCFTSWQCLTASFGGPRLPSHPSRRTEEPRRRGPETRRAGVGPPSPALVDVSIAELDAKMLLLGDVAENGSWWTGGGRGGDSGDEASPHRRSAPQRGEESHYRVHHLSSTKPLSIDWAEVGDWYDTVVNSGRPWKAVYDGIITGNGELGQERPEVDIQLLEAQILAAQDHVQRVLLKAIEVILKRPGRPLTEPLDLRFLLLILANPLLQANCRMFAGQYPRTGSEQAPWRETAKENEPPRNGTGSASGRHSGIIKRIVGLISNSSNTCHNQLVAWLARYPESRFAEIKDLVNGLLIYRLIRQSEKEQDADGDGTRGFLSPSRAIHHMVPSLSAGGSVATLHAALGQSSGGGASKGWKPPPKKQTLSSDDWQVKASARVMTLIFAGNNLRHARRGPLEPGGSGALPNGSDRLEGRVHARGQLLPTSDFYMPLLDSWDLVADFETWESRRGKFSFCQYPFLLSIWAKIQILEHDAKRQKDKRARDAFFDGLLSNRRFARFLDLNIRRECLVEDSLKAVGEAIGSGGDDIKKDLRITFRGEEGVDAGGLRKEWFLLLVREVFNPDHGMFIYDEDSRYCYFNPNSFETSDQYFLVGVVFGLAIYNSTILDVAFPPFAFRKLLSAAPPAQGTVPTHPRTPMTYTLDDLAEFRPQLARGLKKLLEYEGDDVESMFCLDFTINVDKYGSLEKVVLGGPGGEARPVTNASRREFVDLYIRYLLDTSVSRQFEPFKRGFFTVCGGNALSLFRPEEIELLVRGSDEALDITSLRAVAEYDGWGGSPGPAGSFRPEDETTVQWFWESFAEAAASDQRKLLIFITGSDRIPAMGAASLVIRLVCLGEDCGRFPTARTCFNTLALWRYSSRERLEAMLWGAVHESEGFGLK